MNEISLSERDKQTLIYKMAWLRSRKFSIENDQDFIRDTFAKMFAYEATRPAESILLLFQRSLFVLEKEGTTKESIELKDSDYPLMAIFFSEYISYVEAGYPKLEKSGELFAKEPLNVLIKGFAELIVNRIISRSYLSRYTTAEQIAFLTAIQVLLQKLVEVVEMPPAKTAIKKAVKETKVVITEKIPLWEQRKLEQANRTAEGLNNSPAQQLPVVKVEPKPIKKKVISAYTKKELQEEFSNIVHNHSSLSEEDQLKVISYIAKSANRIQDFVNRNNALYFIDTCFRNKISLEIDLRGRFYLDNKEIFDAEFSEAETTNLFEERLKTILFDRENVDWQELAEQMLTSYEKNGMELGEKWLSKGVSKETFSGFVASDSPFRFTEEERELLNTILWTTSVVRSPKVKVENGVMTIVDKDLVSKLELRVNSAGYIIPSTHVEWDTYCRFAEAVFELFLDNDIQLSTEQFAVMKHLLSLVQVFDLTSIQSESALDYKVQRYAFTANEFVKYIYNIEKYRREHSVRGKIPFNKRLSKHLVETVSGFYSDLATSLKGEIFSKIDEAVLIDWLSVLDPDLLSVARLMPNSLADNIGLILSEMAKLKAKSGAFSVRSNPQY